jgi:uncharacterized protein with HEPN domain
MSRLARPALRSILEAIDGIERAMANKSLEEYSADWLLKHGVERGIEIISEAARRIPPDLRNERPEIPWKQVMAIGNILRHNYDRIVDRVVYEVVAHDLRPLRSAIAAMEVQLHEPEGE